MGELKNAYALIIGVGNDLPITVRDATAIYNLLAEPTLGGYPKENITILTEETATRDGILGALDGLINQATEEASVLLFYSGHGGTYTTNDLLELSNQPTVPEEENRDFFFLQPSNFEVKDFNNTWVKAEELREKIGRIKSKRLILLLDCCHAAGMTHNLSFDSNFTPQKELQHAEGLAQNIDNGNGMSIISSCREDQKSWILDGDYNSLFTKCLLEVLRGEHKKYLEEPFIRISETIQYIFKKVPELKPVQRPYANIQIYDDFILSKVPTARIEQLGIESPAVESLSKNEPKQLITSYRETDTANNAVLFVHGFTGEADQSFGVLPDLLQSEPSLEGWDLFPLGYSGAITPNLGKDVWASVEDIQTIADYLKTAIKYKYSRYQRIAIIGYSLGGLVVQKAIVDLDKKERDKISHVLLFGVPSNGFLTSDQNDAKTKALATDGAFISQLRLQWKSLFQDQLPFTLKVIAATQDEYIPLASSFTPFPKEVQAVVAGNHFSMMKVDDAANDTYGVIMSAFKGGDFANKFTDKETINIAMGEYDAVVKELLPQKDALDHNGLKNLIFALEGLDRQEEAMLILEKKLEHSNDSDFLGLLAGRYKRQYLNTYHKDKGELAKEYYQRGFQIAEANKDYKQGFYHAINVAFLALVLERNEQKMQEYAKVALEHAAQTSFNTLWKIATSAEAHLYLGNLKEAQEYYEQASEMADVRQKLSIHTNAYKAYTSLLGTENPEDRFIKFLKKRFLS